MGGRGSFSGVDIEDGNSYTKEEFTDWFDGTDEWETSGAGGWREARKGSGVGLFGNGITAATARVTSPTGDNTAGPQRARG